MRGEDYYCPLDTNGIPRPLGHTESTEDLLRGGREEGNWEESEGEEEEREMGEGGVEEVEEGGGGVEEGEVEEGEGEVEEGEVEEEPVVVVGGTPQPKGLRKWWKKLRNLGRRAVGKPPK